MTEMIRLERSILLVFALFRCISDTVIQATSALHSNTGMIT